MHPNHRKLFLVTFLFFAFVITQSCRSHESPSAPPKDKPVIVDVIVAQKQSVSQTIEANGTVVANEYVALHPEVSGRITYLNVNEGQHVQAGTVIAKLNDADLKAQQQRSVVQLDVAQKNEAALHQLLDVNGVNQVDYDAALNTVNTLKADINYYQALIDKTVIRAPFNGVIGLRQVSLGAFVTSADVIATIQQLSQLKIDFTIPEEYGQYIKKGDSISVAFDAFNNNRERATILAVEPKANALSRNLLVRAVLSTSKENPGSFAKVYFSQGNSEESVLLPADCVIPQDISKQVVLVKSGKATFVNVETGQRFANNVQITSGVQPGDTVIVTGVLFARPNTAVQVRQVQTLEQKKVESVQ